MYRLHGIVRTAFCVHLALLLSGGVAMAQESWWVGQLMPDEVTPADELVEQCADADSEACQSWCRRELDRPMPSAAVVLESCGSACEFGHDAACLVAAWVLLNGMGTTRPQPELAYDVLVELCNEEESGEACFLLAQMLELGVGTVADRRLSDRLFAHACELGTDTACGFENIETPREVPVQQVGGQQQSAAEPVSYEECTRRCETALRSCTDALAAAESSCEAQQRAGRAGVAGRAMGGAANTRSVGGLLRQAARTTGDSLQTAGESDSCEAQVRQQESQCIATHYNCLMQCNSSQ